ncbi:ferredoxin [Nocardia sp. NPDC020380]|uniref:ferredoxin n=1 Tax=Nocardia sp. NPDC020380 TaxID=3364309 RepID=UPI0037A3DCF7
MTEAEPQSRTWQLRFDWTRCDGRGLCSELLPEVLDRDEWGYPLARNHPDGPTITPRQLTAAREAVTLCPRLALTLMSVPRR